MCAGLLSILGLSFSAVQTYYMHAGLQQQALADVEANKAAEAAKNIARGQADSIQSLRHDLSVAGTELSRLMAAQNQLFDANVKTNKLQSDTWISIRDIEKKMQDTSQVLAAAEQFGSGLNGTMGPGDETGTLAATVSNVTKFPVRIVTWYIKFDGKKYAPEDLGHEEIADLLHVHGVHTVSTQDGFFLGDKEVTKLLWCEQAKISEASWAGDVDFFRRATIYVQSETADHQLRWTTLCCK